MSRKERQGLFSIWMSQTLRTGLPSETAEMGSDGNGGRRAWAQTQAAPRSKIPTSKSEGRRIGTTI
jgi:hypothetical protein